MTSKEASEKWRLSKRQINSLCALGKIPAVKLSNGRWEIPDDYEYNTSSAAGSGMKAFIPRKYFNIGNDGFRAIRNSEYIDKTGLISFMNSCLTSSRKLICVSRPRRFGKSFGAKMLCAYYSKGCDSRDLFRGLEISRDAMYKEHLNKHDVLYLDMTFFISTLKEKENLIEKIEKEVIEDLSNEFPDINCNTTLIDALAQL